MKSKSKPPRNPFVLPMTLGRKAGVMKDRRQTKGGTKNLQIEFLDDENCCEHGDHVAPAGKRFCSEACLKCEHESENGCDGYCLKQ